jgi:hypothetical protein
VVQRVTTRATTALWAPRPAASSADTTLTSTRAPIRTSDNPVILLDHLQVFLTRCVGAPLESQATAVRGATTLKGS